MGEPAFRDCADPADLPLFAPVPVSRPGRIRSTFSLRADRSPPETRWMHHQRRRPLCWSEIRRTGRISHNRPDAWGPPGWVSIGRWWRGCARRHRNG